MSRWLEQLRGWPRRRWLAALVTTPPAALVMATSGLPHWWDVALALVSAAVAAVVIASYVGLPGSGRLVDPGCSPCAVVAFASLPISLMARASAPGSTSSAVLGLVVLLGGLRQRLGETACSTRSVDAQAPHVTVEEEPAGVRP